MHYSLQIPDSIMVCPFLNPAEKIVVGYKALGFERMGCLYLCKERTPKEIAEILGIPKPTVERALNKANKLGLTMPYLNFIQIRIGQMPVWEVLGHLYARAYIIEKEYGASFDPDSEEEKRYKESYIQFTSLIFDTESTPDCAELIERCNKHVHILKKSFSATSFENLVKDINKEFQYERCTI